MPELKTTKKEKQPLVCDYKLLHVCVGVAFWIRFFFKYQTKDAPATIIIHMGNGNYVCSISDNNRTRRGGDWQVTVWEARQRGHAASRVDVAGHELLSCILMYSAKILGMHERLADTVRRLKQRNPHGSEESDVRLDFLIKK